PIAWRQWFAPPQQDPLVRFDIATPTALTAAGGGVPATQLAVSPNGRHVAYVASSAASRGALWIRALDAKEPRMLTGTEDALYPSWTPDSSFIGFLAKSKLKKIDITGGPPQVLCNVTPEPRGGTWNPDGEIIFAPGSVTGLLRISASAGGEPTRLLDLQH